MPQQLLQAATEYQQAVAILRDLIQKSSFKAEAFWHHLKLSRAAFYRKLKGGSWEPQEVKELALLLETDPKNKNK